MIRAGAITLTLIVGTQANALSCLRPDPVRSFQNAANATEVYHVYHGHFTLAAPLTNGGQVTATFQGEGLTKNGFVPIPDRDVTLVSQCAASWCGSYESGQDIMAFVRSTPEGLVFDVAPCGNWGFTDPSQETLDAVTSCIRGETCEEGPLFN